MLLTKYIEAQKKSNMPEDLKQILLQNASVWTNDACYGYISSWPWRMPGMNRI